MTRDVDAIRADLAARTVHGSASSAADRDIAALLGVIDELTEAVGDVWCGVNSAVNEAAIRAYVRALHAEDKP